MKPIERIARLEAAAADPVPTADMVAWLAHESRWLTAFVRHLGAELAEVEAQALHERDDARTIATNTEAQLSHGQGFREGTQHANDMFKEWFHNDPAIWVSDGPEDTGNPYGFKGNSDPAPDRPRALVLEFEPVEGGADERA